MDLSEHSFENFSVAQNSFFFTVISRVKAGDPSKDSFAPSVFLPPIGCSHNNSIITRLQLRRISYACVVKIKDNDII